MRIVGSVTYLQDRARRRMSRGIAFVGAGVVLLPLAFILSASAAGGLGVFGGNAGVFLAIGALLLGTLQVLAAGRDRERAAGEPPVLVQLRARLGDEFTYLCHVSLPQRDVHADGVLLGPHGALVLAIRAAPGQFAVAGNDWSIADSSGRLRPWNESPTWEVTRPVRALERAAREEGLGDVPVKGVVVLVHGRLVEAEQPAMAVVPVDRIATYVDYLRSGPPVRPEAVERLREILAPHAGGAAPRSPAARESR